MRRESLIPVKARRGAVAVEFALVLPLLILLVSGIWELGRVISVYQVLTNACREAGRQAASGKLSADEVREVILDYLRGAGIDTTGMPTPTITNITDSARSDPEDAEQLDHYQLTAALPYANVRLTPLNIFVPSSTVLTITTDWYSMKDLQISVSTDIPTL
jgi:Flp pilus assembly protein TadG